VCSFGLLDLSTLQSFVNRLKPSGFFTYRQVEHSKTLHGARFAFSVLFGSKNRQRSLPYSTLADWFRITEFESVYCVVRTESLHKTRLKLIHTYHAVPLPCRAAKGLDYVFPS
jgi:hypothetical protein